MGHDFVGFDCHRKHNGSHICITNLYGNSICVINLYLWTCRVPGLMRTLIRMHLLQSMHNFGANQPQKKRIEMAKYLWEINRNKPEKLAQKSSEFTPKLK